MRLCLVSREFPPFVGGGIGAYTLRLARELARRAHEVVVVTVSTDGARAREHADGFTVVRLPLVVGDDWSRPAPAIASPGIDAAFRAFHPVSAFAMQLEREIPRLHEEFRFDAIEFPDCGAAGWFLLNARRNRPLDTPPVVVCLHSPTAWIGAINRDPAIDLPTRRLIDMEHDCIRWADALVSPSRAMARWAEERAFAPPAGVRTIRSPLGELEALPRATSPAPGAPRRLLYVGRLEARKGVDLLLDAFSRAIERGANLELHLFGRDAHDVRTNARFGAAALSRLPPGARARVRLRGQVRPDALWREPAHAAVVPSPDDNFPYTCVEAMARALPVVATRAGGMAEMVRHLRDGLLVPPEPGAWARALRRVASMPRPLLLAMGLSARARIRRLCASETIVRRRIEHSRSARAPVPPAEERTPDFALLNPPPHETPALARLTAALGRGAAAACGWERTPDGAIRPIAPLTPERLLSEAPPRGPVVIARHACPGADPPRDALPSLLALALASRPIAVVPEAVFDVPASPPPLPPVELETLDEVSLRRLARRLAPRIASLEA